jgi:Ca2+-binding RTX toxin-like protein
MRGFEATKSAASQEIRSMAATELTSCMAVMAMTIYGGAANLSKRYLDGGHSNDTLHGYRGDDTCKDTGGNLRRMGDDTTTPGSGDARAEEGSGGTDIPCGRDRVGRFGSVPHPDRVSDHL